MKIFLKGFNFYIQSSMHVSLAVLAFIAMTLYEYGLDVPFSVWSFVFFGTVTGYNFVKYAEIAGLHHRSLTSSLKTIQVFSFVSFGMMLFFAFHLSINTLAVTGGFALLTFLYAVPLLKRKNLRNFSGLKIFIVALVWAGITVFVPMVEVAMEVTADCWLTFFQRFFMVVVLIIPFEIRDLPYDQSELRTLPQQLGIKKVKVLGFLLLTIVFLLEGFKEESTSSHIISLFLICCLLGIILVLSEKKQSRYFASFWVEGIPILWLAIFLLLRHFLS